MMPEFPNYCESNLIVVAARPAMGKTRYVCALGVERAAAHPVLINTFAYSEKFLRSKFVPDCNDIIINDTPTPTFEKLEENIRSAVKAYNIKTAVIDYLNIMAGFDPDKALAALKSLARELNIEIIAGVSVATAEPEGMVSAPTIEDIRMKETEAVDVFIPLHNPDYYLPRTGNKDD